MMHTNRFSARLRIAIVDPCSANGYDPKSLEIGGLGGTEATVLRVSSTLTTQFDVTHFQNGRAECQSTTAGELMPLKYAFSHPSPDVIVVINRWKVALKLRKLYPDVPIFLWLHVYPGRHNRNMGAALKSADIGVICVSKSHATSVRDFLEPAGAPDIHVIYNALADYMRPDDTPRDPNRLLFASSPHKGLSEIFEQFSALRGTLPDLTLTVADPGYLSWETGPVPSGVEFLGSLSHADLVRQMRRSLCLFYPQTTFAETFGLVLAEANAVGTPALVHHGLGANNEVVSSAEQCVNGHDPAQILARIKSWRRMPPTVQVRPAFRLSRVARDWANLLEGSSGRQTPRQKSMV